MPPRALALFAYGILALPLGRQTTSPAEKQPATETATPTSAAPAPPGGAPGDLQTAPPIESLAPAPEDYILGPGDELSIHVLDLDEIPDRTLRIDEKGDVNLPVAGQIHATGLSARALQDQIKDRIRVYLRDPSVTVTVTQARDEPVTVLGAVRAPGVKQVRGRKTLLEILSEAGGILPDAGPVVKITRLEANGPIPLPGNSLDSTGNYFTAEVDLATLIKAKKPGENIQVQSHDIVAIPPAEMVYVLGEVSRPAEYEITGGRTISVLDAVAKAGGTNRNASSSRCRVLRAVPGKAERTEFIVDLNRMLAGKDKDFELEALDILYIPTNRGKVVTNRALEAMIGAGSSIAVFRSSR